jgi:hypothetical protein
MRTRLTVALLVVVLTVYLVLVGYQGVLLIGSGEVAAVALGIAVFVLPLIGAYVVWREIGFGRATTRLSAALQDAGRWPTEELPTMPSGRPQRDAADALFAERRREVESHPEDWGSWYRLGLAYEDAGDRKRARQAIRHAIALHDS